MSYTLKQILSDFVSFLKNPSEVNEYDQSKKFKLKRLITLLILDLILSSIIIFIVTQLNNIKLINSADNKIVELLNLYPLFIVILLSVIILPLFEEVIFRLHLKFKNFYVLQLILKLITLFKINNSDVGNNALNLWNKYYKFVFYITALIFSFLHLFNYTITIWVIVFSPVLIFAQFICGVIIGYLRVSYGFNWGYLFHILHNLIFMGLPLLFINNEIEVYNFKNQEYSFTISENQLKNKETSISILKELDSVIIKGCELKQIIPIIFEKDKKYLEINDDLKQNKYININYISKIKNEHYNSELIINNLKKLYKFDIETKIVSKNVWELQVADSTKLNKFLLNNNRREHSETSVKDDNINLNMLNLEEIANFLSEQYKILVITTSKSNSIYNLNFKESNFEEFRKMAFDRFGLKLVEKVIPTEITIINFKK